MSETDLLEVLRNETGADENLADAYFASYPAPLQTEVIIPATDDRVRINPTTAYPWRAICALKITAGDGSH